MASPLAQNPNATNSVRVRKGRQPFRHLPRLSFLSSRVAGHRWAMLPSAAGFVDPLLSTGFPLTLLGIERLARILESGLDSRSLRSDLEAYERVTTDELLATARLIAALYANMRNFALFKSLCLLYFAAASYSETARRLGKPHLASSFLLHDHPQFGPRSKVLIERAMHISGNTEAEPTQRRHPASHRADRCGRIEETEHAQLVPRGRGRPACFLFQAGINADRNRVTVVALRIS